MGRVTLITGASSGLGAALAPLMATDGDTLVLAARRVEKVEAVAERIRAAGGAAHVLPLDVADHAAVTDAVALIERDIGPLHTLLLNAGVGDNTPADGFDADTFEWIVRVNLLGVAYCLEAALPHLIARRAGHVVGMGSMAGYRGLPGSAGYTASKAGLRSMLESMRIELRAYGIPVTLLVPGFVKTELTARNDFEMPFLMELDEAARRMHRAIRREATEYMMPAPMAALVRLSKLVPNAVYDRALKNKRHSKKPISG